MDFDVDTLPDEFSQKLFAGSLPVLDDKENAVRLHLFAAGFRELFTHILNSYASEEEVRACSWFVQAEDTPTVTRRQRAIYATQGGLADEFVGKLGLDIHELHKAAIKAIDKLSAATHVREGQVVSDEGEITEFVANALASLGGLPCIV